MHGIIALKVLRKLGPFELCAELELQGQGVTVLFGPSGSGKTTLIRFMAGLDPEARGCLRVNGRIWQEDERGLFLKPHQRPLGYVFQEAALFPHLNVLENLRFGMRRISRDLGSPDFDAIVSLLNLDGLLKRSPLNLSGGEQQRVAIARALLVRPEILLMDEPFSALDAGMKREILPYLEALVAHESIPVVYVTHSLSEAQRLGDYLVYLREGRVVSQGPIERMMEVLKGVPGDEEEMGAMIRGVILEKDEGAGLARVGFDGGEIWVTDPKWELGCRVRCRILPSDVSLSLTFPGESSILNRLWGEVTEVLPLPLPLAGRVRVRVRVGNADFYSLVTSKSLQALDLYRGRRVFVQFKACSILP